jgi:hypothetical protein
MLEPWLKARDAASLRAAWTALRPVRREVTHPHRWLTVHGAARLAEVMLGERADWIVDLGGQQPSYETNRVVPECFVDHLWNVSYRCQEAWTLHERRGADGGVQVLTVSCGTVEGRPEGGVATTVRVFDRERAVSVHIGTHAVAVIGNVDLAPLDLYLVSQNFLIPDVSDHLEVARGLVAMLAAELDAHYDTSALWSRIGRARQEGSVVHTFGEGERSITVAVKGGDQAMTTTVHGLPWGHKIELGTVRRQRDVAGYIILRLPDADIDRVVGRLGAIAPLS